MIGVLLVDDQALVRGGLRLCLATEPDLEIVGEAADGGEAVEAAGRLRPDVVLMDVRMPAMDGIEATRRIVQLTPPPAPRVIVLTTFDLDEHVYDALAAGASGFLLKDIAPDSLPGAVRLVAQGDALLAPSVTRRLISRFARRPAPDRSTRLQELTPREADVLQLLARGLSNPEIAAKLHVSGTTVKTHVAHLLDKLDLRDRVQAVVFAYESGLVEPGDPACG